MKKRFKGKRKRSAPALPSDPHDRIVVRLPCYEPAGQFLELTEGDFLRSMLLTGGTGAGKSSCLYGILADLIAYRCDDEAHRPGLVLMDNQADSTILKIRHLAATAGREDDVLHLSPDEGWYCPVGQLDDWAEIDRATERLISASRFMDERGDNRYWAENTKILVEASLVIMLVTSGQVRFTDLLHFASDWLVGGADTSPPVKRRLDVFRTVAEQAMSTLTPAIAMKIRFTLSTLHLWQNMEYRTKAILRSCVGTVLRPFLSVYGLRYWDHPRIDPARALDGKIVVISIPAGVEPELATVLGRLAKMDFYAAAQRRRYKPGDRLVAMVQDEFPYSVTVGSSRWSDVTNLATLRARGACLIAASQGIANLQLAIGNGNGSAGTAIHALLLNFSNLIFFRSQEPAIDLWAARLFGLKVTRQPRSKEPPQPRNRSNLAVEDTPSNTPPDFLELVCPPGTLARLQTHQAYVSLANGWRTQEPVWLAPHYIDIDVQDSTPTDPDHDMKIITEIRNQIPLPEGPGDVSL